MVKKIQINLSISNKMFYTLITIGVIILLGIGVYAYGSAVPSTMGHSSEEIVVDDTLCTKITGHACGTDTDTDTTIPDTNTWRPIEISSGFCVFSDSQTSCPSGFTRDSSFDGRTIYGTSSSSTNGGTSTHIHTTQGHSLTTAEMPSHTHTETSWSDAPGYGWDTGAGWARAVTRTSGTAGSGNAHTHGDTGTGSSWPPYRTVVVCCKS